MIEKNNIAAVVVSYNIKKDELLNNINSYINCVDIVIVVDNSDKNTELYKIQENSKIKYINLEENKGIAKGLNEGINYAIKNKYKFVLTMDQDSKFSNNLIKEYAKNEANNIIIYSPNYLIERKRKKIYRKDTTELTWTMTSGNLLNLNLYKLVGSFREDFFIDGVDYEYCLRAKRYGYKILQCNEAILIHNPGITKKKNIFGLEYKYGYMSPERMYYQVRNLSYISKEYKSVKAQIIILIKFLKIILLFDNKKDFIKYFKRAIDDYKNNKTGKIDHGE